MPIPDQEAWEDWVFSGPEPDFEQLSDPVSGRLMGWPLTRATALFSTPRHLSVTYSERQLRVGFGRLPHSWNLAELLWEPEQTRDDQIACFRSMVTLYEEFFVTHPLDTIAFMWWDALRPGPSVTIEPALEQAAIDALEAILQLPSEDCAYAALHGLGHLHHPRKVQVVQAFVAKAAGKSPGLMTYARQSLDGKVL